MLYNFCTKNLRVNQLLYLSFSIMLLYGCSSNSSNLDNVGIINNKLKPCPDSPNCVSSFENNNSNSYVKPIYYSHNISLANVVEFITNTVENIPRVKLITRQNNYLHFEFRTFLGFVDDVEFLVDNANKTIHFRSASRIGYYDFKKNHTRYLQIKSKLTESIK
ncbi:MAG: DUF1499 domain-containing protein [Rickettsiaceae bacterium]|nr:DUF1499 domain-containing protein [Rickettsiaceae bacterium]